MIWVHVTVAPEMRYVQSDVGRCKIRTDAAIGGARQAMIPSRISARPSVPIIFTSGSRPAKAGPKMTP